MYNWIEEWPHAFSMRKFSYANLYPYAGRSHYRQFEDAMWVLAIELSYSL